MTRRRDLARSAAVLLVSTAVFSAAPAFAIFNDVHSASLPVSTTSLAAPTGLTATASCSGTTPRVAMSWTASASTYATGYQIYRKIGVGAFLPLATVSGRTTTTYTDSPALLSTLYSYYVATTFYSWSANSSPASTTTPALCL